MGQSGYPFRIDHDERFNETTHLQYQLPIKLRPWVGFNWRFDSGLVAGAVPCYNVTDPNSLCTPSMADHRLRSMGSRESTSAIDPGSAVPGRPCMQRDQGHSIRWDTGNQCLASQFTSNLVSIPAPGTENDDHNPPRIAQRSLFDVSLGQDNLFNGDKRRWSLRLTAVNITNKYALYNFLSTFSGTHYVTPRAMNAELLSTSSD